MPAEVSKPAPLNADQPPFNWKASLLWFGAALLAVVVLSVTASYAPSELKRLVLFHIVFGVACGMVLLWLAAELRPGWRISLPVWSGMLCLLGALNMGWLSFQHFQKAREEFAAAHPRDAAMTSMLEQIAAQDPEMKARFEEERRRVHPRFQDYLKHRVSGLGDWKSPFAELFWALEVLLSAVACGWTVWVRAAEILQSPLHGVSANKQGTGK